MVILKPSRIRWFSMYIFNRAHFKTVFQNIGIFQKLNIDPAKYMELIYDLTEDWVRRPYTFYKVKTFCDKTFCHTEQILTELGICYSTNNYLLDSLSTRYIHRCCAPQVSWAGQKSEKSDISLNGIVYGIRAYVTKE